ncbi:MAG: hypothetical protein HYW49_06395 [Deltaproteobacteria bacterium]|nr:hypothetical protein [Deltaproteobacteria bacterium]
MNHRHFDQALANKNGGLGLELAINLMDFLSANGLSAATVDQIIARLKKWSGCKAVGVRLWDGNAVPPFGAEAGASCGAVEDKCSVRECFCGDVVWGDAELLIGGGKSFWTNSVTRALGRAPRAQTRLLSGYGRGGYESVALIPLRADKEIFGLLQIADQRKEMFSAGRIRLLEKIAMCLAVVIARIKAVEASQRSEQDFRKVIEGAREGILVLTMHDNPESVRELLASGISGYVLKTDCSLSDLAAGIRGVTSGGAFFSSGVSKAVLGPAAAPRRKQSLGRDPNRLSDREREILALVAGNCQNKEIASRLGISVRTVTTHREHVMRKLGIHGVASLTRYAISRGLVAPRSDT